MGFGGISAWQLIIILVIVLLIFGTKKLRGVGGDLGSAIKSFKKAVKEEPGAKKSAEDNAADTEESTDTAEPEAIEAATSKTADAVKPAASEKTV